MDGRYLAAGILSDHSYHITVSTAGIATIHAGNLVVVARCGGGCPLWVSWAGRVTIFVADGAHFWGISTAAILVSVVLAVMLVLMQLLVCVMAGMMGIPVSVESALWSWVVTLPLIPLVQWIVLRFIVSLG
jgi:hypothetical protein